MAGLQPFDSEAWIARMTANNERLRQELEAEIAALPEGVCVICFGTRRVKDWRRDDAGRRCPECDPPDTWAQGVPVEFQSSRFANYETLNGNGAALERARRFIASPQRDLYLVGGVGAGKTRLACAIANELFASRRGAMFVRVPMVLHKLQPGRSDEDYEQRLFAVPFLVMDDIGAERDQATDYTRRTLLMIYEERGDRGLRTIFTSNKTLSELGAMQDDDRLSSRIAGRADVVKLSTGDQRLLRRSK